MLKQGAEGRLFGGPRWPTSDCLSIGSTADRSVPRVVVAMTAESPGGKGLSAAVHRDGGEVVVDIRGELDDYTAPRLRETLEGLAEEGVADLVLDLGDMTFIDSTGLGVLVGALKRSQAQHGQVTLRRPSPATRKVLELTGLHKVFTLVDGAEGP